MAFSSSLFPFLLSREMYNPNDFLGEYISPMALLNSVANAPARHRRLLVRPRNQASGDSESALDSKSDPTKFNVMVNVKHFKPEELTVKTVDNSVVIHGKHEESADAHGFVSREFTRRYAIPEDVEPEKIQSFLSQDGILTIRAPRKEPELPTNERVVPITVQQLAVAEEQQRLPEQQQPQEEME